MNARSPRPTTLLLRRLGRGLQRHLAAAITGDPTGVHQARVASRRLREAIPVLATGLKGSRAGKASRKVRRLTRALGTVRELDVTLQLLDELAAVPEVSRGAVEEVRAAVMRERDARREVMLKRLARVDAARLGRRLASVGSALDISASEPWRKALAARLADRSKALVAAMDAAGHMYAPDRLHDVRIAAKKLRYGLELAVDSGAPKAVAQVRAIKRLQEMLGRLHDLQVLQSHIAAAQIAAGPGGHVSGVEFDALAAHVEAECRHLHAKYLSACPALREVPAAIRSGVVPQLAPRRSSPMKMTLSRNLPPAAARGGR